MKRRQTPGFATILGLFSTPSARRVAAALAALPLLSNAACADTGSSDSDPAEATAPPGGDEESEENVGESREPIINGTTMIVENSGFVMVGGCTGTLLTNAWVLTAAHCLSSSQMLTPQAISVTYGAQTRAGAHAYKHPSLDVALVYVGAPFMHKGKTWGHRQPLFAGQTQNLVGRKLFCAGYGYDTYGGGFGTLRIGLITVGAVAGQTYRLDASAQGQVQWLGDSGGSCMLDVDGGRLLTGVQSTATHSPNQQQVYSANQPSAEHFRDWAMNVMASPARFENPWPSPLAHNFNGSTQWSPCGGGCFTWNAQHSFEQNYDFGKVAGTQMTGTGTTTGSACGSVAVQSITDYSVQSTGFSSLTASCQSAILCDGNGCSTSPSPLPNNVDMATLWQPCPSGCFNWAAVYTMENGYDYVDIDNQHLTGAGATTGSGCNPVSVTVHTDQSVSSPGLVMWAGCGEPTGPCHSGNTCGGYSGSGACWCDQACVTHGDCCSDGPC
jgi:hypothetical protein